MANEVILKDGKLAIAGMDVSPEEKYIRLGIIVRNVKREGKPSFKSVKGYMYLGCYDNGNYQGKKGKWLDVKFTREAFKDSETVKSVDDLKTGDLYVYATKIQAPSKYEITKKDGKDVYPVIYIKGGIIGFIPYTPSQEAFNRPDYEDALIETSDPVESYDEEASSVVEN